MTSIDNNIVQERRQVATCLLTVLQALINEQVKCRLLDKSVGKYIYDSLRHTAKELGYIHH